ncbi:hypothetical protein ACJX0J_037823, partial [Zea mays]
MIVSNNHNSITLGRQHFAACPTYLKSQEMIYVKHVKNISPHAATEVHNGIYNAAREEKNRTSIKEPHFFAGITIGNQSSFDVKQLVLPEHWCFAPLTNLVLPSAFGEATFGVFDSIWEITFTEKEVDRTSGCNHKLFHLHGSIMRIATENSSKFCEAFALKNILANKNELLEYTGTKARIATSDMFANPTAEVVRIRSPRAHAASIVR